MNLINSKTFPLKKFQLPDQIKRFYEDNGLEISQNLLPLDLDTLIVLSNEFLFFKKFRRTK